MELTYKECDEGSAKNTNAESVVGYILLLSELRRKFPLSSLGSVIYPLSFAFQLTISSEFFLPQPLSLSISLLPEFLLICLQFCPLCLGPIPCILVLFLNYVLCTCALMDHRREGRSGKCVLGAGSSVTSWCVQGGNHRAHTSLSAAGDTVLEAGRPGITTSVFPSPHLRQRFRTENIF